MNLPDPRTAVNELVTKLTALKLPASYDATEPAAFDKVKIFDLQDLAKALEELFIISNRVCLVGLDAVNDITSVQGRNLIVERSISVALIMSDRRYSDRQKAMMGDVTTPGAIYLETLVVNGLAGELTSGSIAEPGDGRLLGLEAANRDNQTGRIVFVKNLTITLGWDSVSLSRKAKVAPAD